AALNGADACGGDIPVRCLEFAGIVGDVLQHRTKIFQIEKQQSLVVGNLENDRQNSGLGVVQIQKAGNQQRAHLRNRGTNGVSLLAEDIPEHDRTSGELQILELQLFRALEDMRILTASLREPREVSLYIGKKHRRASLAETLGEFL